MGHGDHGGHGGHGHDHGQSHGHSHNGAACTGHKNDLEAPLIQKPHDPFEEDQNKLRKAVYFAVFMMFVEIFGGILANSLAIITDAAHMLSDVGGFIVSLVCLQLAASGATTEYTFGYKQAEVLGALLSITIVWALTACLLMKAVERFYDLEEVNAPYMFGISVLGFLVNLILMKVLGHNHAHGGGGGHDHGHGHSHGGHGDEDDIEASLAMKAAIAHVIGDIVQSLGVCLAAACIWVKPWDVGVTENGVSKWNYADPMCTVLFGILVLFTTKSTLTQTINTLMVKAPPQIDQAKLTDKLVKCPNVSSIHDLHVWMMGSRDVLCTAHLMIDSVDHATAALKGAIEAAKSMGIAHSTFQIEIVGEFDPALESYGIHENPVGSPTDSQPKSEAGHGGHGHSHNGGRSHDGGHSGQCSGHSHSGGHSHGGGHGHSH